MYTYYTFLKVYKCVCVYVCGLFGGLKEIHIFIKQENLN